MDKLYTDWSLKNVLTTYGKADIALTQVNDHYRESVFSFNEPGIVNGSIKTHSSPNMEVSMMEMHLERDIIFRVNDGVSRMGATVLHGGQLSSTTMYDHSQRKVDHGQHIFTYSHNYQNEFTVHNGRVSLFHLNLKPEFLHKAIENEVLMDKVLKNVTPDDFCVAFQLSFSKSSVYQDVISSITGNQFTGIAKQLYIEGKAFEMFSLQLNELLAGQNLTRYQEGITIADREKLKAAHDFVAHNYIEPLSLGNLAMRFQLNEFKLKRGYKQLYNTTVFGHVYSLRMQQAKMLLRAGGNNVAEVAYMVGYSSPNNFSTAFAKMFGYSPNKIARK